MIDLAERLERFPATSALLVSGTISPAEADQVSRASARNPAAEGSLLDTARSESFSRLKDAANAVVSPDPDDDRRRAEQARKARAVRTWTDADGIGHLHAKGPVDLIGILEGRIGARAEEYFAAARSSGEHQESPAYRFDALFDLVCGIPETDDEPAEESGCATDAPDPDQDPPPTGNDPPGGHDPPPGAGRPKGRSRRSKRLSPGKVDMLIRIDFAALRRGCVEGDEICEIAGVGPVSVAAAREYLGGAALKFILSYGKDIRAVAHAGRNVGSELRTALRWQYRRCSAPGCDRYLGLQQDHQLPVGKGGWTSLENLQLLCRSCHEEKTKQDYPNGTAYLRRNRTPAA